MYIWRSGREVGVVAVDIERRGSVYFLRLVDYIQSPLCIEIQSLDPTELDLCLSEMLKEIKYYEEYEAEKVHINLSIFILL